VAYPSAGVVWEGNYLLKKDTSVHWLISCRDTHKDGENEIVSSFDNRTEIFDSEGTIEISRCQVLDRVREKEEIRLFGRPGLRVGFIGRINFEVDQFSKVTS